jgi:PPP family 3-phenylpropionic acid transporter
LSDYWRLSSFYFCYFALLGAWAPFWGPYLQDQGFNSVDIGYLAAIIYITKVFSPSIWSYLADKSGQHLHIVRLGSLLAFFCFLFIFLGSSFWLLALVVTAYSFFWNAVLAQFEVITITHLAGRYHSYSRIRLWGSIGFIAAVVGLGAVFDFVPISALPVFIASILLAIFISSLFVAKTKTETSLLSPHGIFTILKRPAVWAFLLVGVLLQISHAPYYTFFSIYMELQGYSSTLIGLLWGLGVAVEVLVFIWMHKLLARYSIRQIMLVSLLLAALRWFLIGYFSDNLLLLLIAQTLHAASFGSFHAVAVEYVRRQFVGGHQGQGMAVYSGLSFGGGSAIGAVVSGLAWQLSPAHTFAAAGVVCVFAFIIAWFLIKGAESDRLSF